MSMIKMLAWSVCLVCLSCVASVLAGGGYGSYRNIEYDCGGSCGGGAPLVGPDGCATGNCQGGYDDGSSYGHSSGYHRSESSVVRETNTKHVKVSIGVPSIAVHKVSRIISAPVYHAPPRRVYSDCDYGCGGGGGGGGSKVVKIIKKTTYKTVPTYHEVCSTCGGEAEYVEEPVVIRKVTKVIKRPKVVKVVKVIDDDYSGGGGYGGGHSGAYAYSSSGGGGYGGGGFRRGGRGGGCKFGCDEWKKK